MLRISEFRRKKTSSEIKTAMRNQYYSVGLLKIYGPGNQEFSEVLCKHCTPSTHMSCPVASSKRWMGNKARRSYSALLQAWRHSSQGQGFVCVVSALHHVSFLSLSLLPVCVVRNIWKRIASAFWLLSFSMADGSSVQERALADFD